MERYNGDSNPKAPLNPANMTSGPMIEDSKARDDTHKYFDQRLAEMESRLTAKILLKLDNLKLALNIDSDTSDDEEEAAA